MKYLKLIFLIAVIALSVAAQEEKAKPRIFVSDSQSWEMAGGFAANKDAAAGSARGGARPQDRRNNQNLRREMYRRDRHDEAG